MAKIFRNNKKSFVEPRINDEIKGYDTVRVLYDDGDEKINKVMALEDAFSFANRKNLDVIEVNSKSRPAIVKIANYSKYFYELKKQLKNKPKPSELKEIQLSTNISSHDLEIKSNKAREFILNGDKVKVVLRMRGRELSRREESKRCLLEFIVSLDDVALPESQIKDENNKSIVILKKR